MAQFETFAQKQFFETAVSWLQLIYKPAAIKVSTSQPMIWLLEGSAVVRITIVARKSGQLSELVGDVAVGVECEVVQHVKLVPDLLLFLLRRNGALAMGSLAIDANGDIIVRDLLWGKQITREDFLTSVAMIASSADELDDEIVHKWGGERAIDLMK